MKQNLRKNNNKPELLAPAGNIETFYAVLRAGADAVYLAGNRFGARAYADNFSDEEIISCIHFAHLFGKKVYLTVNTLTRNNELPELIDFIKPLYLAGLDAVIVQDLGVFSSIRESFPKLELHASTQMNITTSMGASLLKDEGACRIVPARELSLPEIKKIKADTGLELECFIHGAMCYCYSGQCLFSSVIGKRSGNRGKCAQPCRLPYSIENNREIYPLSLKDMCTAGIIGELIEAGIDSFKIEGRMKKPEYAAGVTAIYRRAIDNYLDKGESKLTNKDIEELTSLYIRSEISTGYYHKHNGKDMVTLTSPSYNGAKDSTLDEIRDLYIGENAKKQIEKYDIRFFASFIEGSECTLTGVCGDYSSVAYGDIVQVASKSPIKSEDISKQLSKLGNTCFRLSNDQNFEEDIIISSNPYYSLKGINELRRNVVSDLEKQIIEGNGFDCNRNLEAADNLNLKAFDNNSNKNDKELVCESQRINALHVMIHSESQLGTLYDLYDDNNKVTRVYIPEELLINGLNIPPFKSIECYIALAHVRRQRDEEYINQINKMLNDNALFKGVLVSNIEDLYRFYKTTNVVSDYSVYCWNNKSIEFLSKFTHAVALPIELSENAQKELFSNEDISFEKMIYGRIPLMHSANCVAKSVSGCLKNEKLKLHKSILKDRTGRDNVVFIDCFHCQNTIYNSLPLSIYKNINKLPSNISFRIDFTDEEDSMVKEVLDYYLDINGKPTWEYTSGFEKQSAE